MRHRHGQSKLNRTSPHRKAMLMNMSNSLILHERISTTLPKAKTLRQVVEPLITLGKRPSVANRRLAFSRLRDRDSVFKIFNELGPRYQSRPGGYVRILKDGYRKGDNAPMALVELMDRPAVEEASPAPETPNEVPPITYAPEAPSQPETLIEPPKSAPQEEAPPAETPDEPPPVASAPEAPSQPEAPVEPAKSAPQEEMPPAETPGDLPPAASESDDSKPAGKPD